MTTYSDPGGGGAYGALNTTTSSAIWLYGSLGAPSVDAVNQGGAGDCWFLSALICMATFDPTYLESMIAADSGGYYSVKLYIDGVAQSVEIGDDLPDDANSGNGNGNWASLIEKAYAAVKGSYIAMDGNSADTAFGALIGLSCTDLNIDNGNAASVAFQIEAAVQAGKGVEIYSDDLFIPQAQPANDGLNGSFPTIDYNPSTAKAEGLVLQFTSGSHAYAVVGYDSATGNLIVRNPWGDAGSTDYSNTGVTYPNAYVSTGADSTDGLTAPPGSNGAVMRGGAIDYFSEFEISASDLQYFYAGAITNAPLAPPPAAPTVDVQNISVVENTSISESAFVTGVTNPSGDSIAAYGFYDAGGGSGYLMLNGVAQPDGNWVDVPSADLNAVQYVGGSTPGTDTIDVEILDGVTGAWSASAALTATTTTVNLQDFSFAGAMAGYSVAGSSNDVTVVNKTSGVTSTLVNVAQITFSDYTLVFDLTSSEDALVYELYQAAYDRIPDHAGFTYWAPQADANQLSALTLATAFLSAPEFTLLYGSNPTNAHYVTELYTNVLGRTPDAAGLSYWIGEANGGMADNQLLVEFATSAENQSLIAPHMANGYWTKSA